MKTIIISCVCVAVLVLIIFSIFYGKRDETSSKRLHDVKVLAAAFADIYRVDKPNVTIQMLLDELEKKNKKLYYSVLNNTGKYRYKIVYPYKTVRYYNKYNEVVIEDDDNGRDVCISLATGGGLLLKRDEYERMLIEGRQGKGVSPAKQ